MLLLVSGASRTVTRLSGTPGLGILLTPAAGNAVSWARRLGLPWACDNAAFSGFDPDAYAAMVGRVFLRLATNSTLTRPLWITAPDVPFDSAATRRIFDDWEPFLAARDLPIAFVAQDGTTPSDVPWEKVSCLFLGGSTAWKLSDPAQALTCAAKARDKLVHMGRVNSRRRLLLAASWGVDSIDGSGFSRFPDATIPRALGWATAASADCALERYWRWP